MEKYFEKDYVKISYDKSNHVIIHEWLTPPTEQEFKEGCNQLVSAFEHFQTGKLIVDTREQGTVAGELMEWMTTDWLTRAVAVGYTYGAIITPTDVFASMSVDEIMESVSKEVTFRYSNNMEDAMDWIKNQPEGKLSTKITE